MSKRFIKMSSALLLGFLSLILSIVPTKSHALETDQYMTFGIELSESSQEIDNLVNTQMTLAALSLSNGKDSSELSCMQAAYKALKWVGGEFGKKIGVPEEYILENTKIDIFPDRNLINNEYINNSIYQSSLLLKTFPLAPTLKVNGVYVGSDKLGHFFSLGRYYYRIYLRSRKLGLSHDVAVKNSFKMGLISEKTYYGFLASGVFSYADLQANYDGFRWILSFCDDVNPKLYKVNNTWFWSNDFKITDFVSPLWDETYNTNSYTKRRGKQVKKHLDKLCSDEFILHMNERVDFYSNHYSKYFENDFRKLLTKKQMPEQIPQSFCKN